MSSIVAKKGSKLLFLMVAITLMGITSQPSLVEAVDIQGFDSPSACSGPGYTFPGIGSQVCTAMNVGSVLIRDLSSCQTGRAYRDGGCTTSVSSGNGPTVWCFVGGSFTGAAWFNNCPRRKLQETDAKCTDTAIPSGIHYTESLSKGSWVLHTPDATDMLMKLRGVDDGEKVAWLKAHGAHHVLGSDKVTIV